MNELQNVFKFRGQEVRTFIQRENTLFVAKDVCDILDIGNPSDALKRLDEDEKDLVSIEGFRGAVNLISESGLYNLILGSRKREAKQFKRWVTHEVLPAIRKHGAYMTPDTLEKAISNPDFVIGLLTNLKVEQEKRQAAEAKVETQQPKVLFAESVEASQSSILIRELAVLLKQNGINTGERRLYDWMRDKGYLVRRHGSDRNTPTQRSMNMGLFEIKETPVNHNSGLITVNKTTKVTGKGQVYFINKFLGKQRAI